MFDDESGQMYTETYARVRSRHHSDWIGELKTPSLVRRSQRTNDTGARSLAAIATSQVTNQFRYLTAAHFKNVPWTAALGIWSRILSERRESFHTWRVLATAYPINMASHRYHLHIRQPSLAPDAYFSGLNSASAVWLTCLRVSPKELSTPELVAVAKIANLAVLDLSDGQIAIDVKKSSFDERIMRTWAEIAGERKGFRHLKVLMLGWQEVEAWVFKYLPYFPKLSHVVITDSPKLNQRNRKEWESTALAAGFEARHAKKSAKSLRPILDDPDFHKYSVSGFLLDHSVGADGHREPSVSEPQPIQPILECWLGTPRKWTHILEDFPGTRTVYFDRVKQVQPTFNIFGLQAQPDLSNQSRTPRFDSKASRIGRAVSKRPSQSTYKSRKTANGLAEMLDGISGR
jgi:hypothetical protein